MTAITGPGDLRAVLDDVRGPILICSHVNPDGDAIGSVLGLGSALEARGLTVVLGLADEEPVPSTYAFLPNADALAPVDPEARYDCFIALDSSDPERLGLATRHLDSARVVLTIDHHPDNPGYGTHQWIDPTAPAVGIMIWEALSTIGIEPTVEIATCLYTALMTDTGRFQHDNTTSRGLRAAADMVDAGADPTAIARSVYQSRSPASQALTALVIGRITLANDGRVAYSWFDHEDLTACGASAAETEDLVDWVRMTDGPAVAFLAKVGEEDTKLSLRARGSYDVGSVARALGGGGHRAASGATVSGGLDAALAVTLPLLPGGEE